MHVTRWSFPIPCWFLLLPMIMYRFSSRLRKGAAEPVHAPLFLALFTVQTLANDMPLAAPTLSEARLEQSDD